MVAEPAPEIARNAILWQFNQFVVLEMWLERSHSDIVKVVGLWIGQEKSKLASSDIVMYRAINSSTFETA